jgi:hypothetical protein
LGKRSRKRSSQPAGEARPKRAAPAKARPPRPAAREDSGGRSVDGAPDGSAPGNGPPPKKPSRSEAKDAAARAALVPLAEGERPPAVTVAAIVAALLGLANAIPFFAGIEFRGDDPQPGVLVFSLVLLIAAWGMWKARYWAVLGMQALLALIILVFSLYLVQAENVKSALIALAIIVPAGVLFWKMVGAMARIQMPERRPG